MVSYDISSNELEILKNGQMLNERHINSASALINQNFPEIKGLQNTLNHQRKENGFKPVGDGSIQIFYCGDEAKHWVTTCSMDNKVYLYDSLPQKTLSNELQTQIKAVYGQTTQAVVISNVQKQKNGVDCRCYSIAWAFQLALGEKLEEILLDSKSLDPTSPSKDFYRKGIDTFSPHSEESPHTVHHHISDCLNLTIPYELK